MCGTPDYLAPEVLNGDGHSFQVDWWTLGILTYEMIVGQVPFYAGQRNYEKMFEQIKKRPVMFPDQQRHNITISDECKDFILKLLDKKADTRLGVNGLDEVLAHPWLSGLDPD